MSLKLHVKYIFSEEKGKSRFYHYKVMGMDADLLARERKAFDVYPIKKDGTAKVKVPNLVIPNEILAAADRWTEMEFDIWVKKRCFPAKDRADNRPIRCCSFVLTRIEVAG